MTSAPSDRAGFPWGRASALLAVALATAVAGTRSREAALLSRALPTSSEAGPCALLGRSERASATHAAVWNGALIHCADYDDTHQASVVHPSAAVLPAALAAADSGSRTVGDLIQAYALGCESVIRLALAAPGGFHARGFHATAVCGPVGAAVAAGWLGEHDERTIRAAAGIAATLGAGSFEYINSGGNSKVLYPGFAARTGLEAVALAAAGFRPPTAAVDGTYGLLASHTGVRRPAPPLVLGTTAPADGWRFTETAVKSYPCCYFSQVFLDALALLRDGVPPDQVERIECHGPREMLKPVFEPRERRIRPVDGYDAKFALPFQLAAMLVTGRMDVSTFASATLVDPRIGRLAERVVPVFTDELGRYPAAMPGRVVLCRRDAPAVSVALDASRGAGSWELGSEYVTARLRRDLGALAPTLVGVLSDPAAPVHRLTEPLAGGVAASAVG